MKFTFDPTRMLEIAPTGAVSVNSYKAISLQFSSAPATNTQAVAAVSGQIVRVFKVEAQSVDAAIGRLRFKSNSGGTGLWGAYAIPLGSTAGEIYESQFDPDGMFETSVGHGLFFDVLDDDINFRIKYIQYTP